MKTNVVGIGEIAYILKLGWKCILNTNSSYSYFNLAVLKLLYKTTEYYLENLYDTD